MEARTFFPGSRTYRAVMALYRTAFPPEQRFCPGAVWLMSALHRPVEFLAWQEDGALLGMSYTVDTGKNLYIYYLAVNSALRSRGVGGEILSELRQRHPDRVMVLDVEAPDPASEEYETQCRRVAFYTRNGFYPLDHHVTTNGHRQDILSTSLEFDSEEYWKAFRLMSQPTLARLKKLQTMLGLWK